MSRREQNRTDESTTSNISITDSFKNLVINTFGGGLNYYIFGDEEQSNAPSETILCRMLSTKTAISTKSSLAEANQRAHEESSQQHFSCIGEGQCGTVYALRGTSVVIKMPNTPAKENELFLDFQTHELVSTAFDSISSLPTNIHVPNLVEWVRPVDTNFWNTHAKLFPPGTHVPSFGLLSERIFPVPRPVRAAIIDALCPKGIRNIKEAFLNKPENRDCLIRLYLGRRHDTRNAEPRTVRLRNFPLHVNEMERLGLDTAAYAKTMAQALALLHWQAGIDGNDVEFVLGSSPTVAGKLSREAIHSSNKSTLARTVQMDFQHRTISMWLVDFNQCRKFTQDEGGLAKLVESFWFNDPYYPRPNATEVADKNLWAIWSQHYLSVSAELTRSSYPQKFIDAVVRKGKQRSNSLFG
ncbi:hypothetical protein ACN47E_004723 [Coniothyrium glycines]